VLIYLEDLLETHFFGGMVESIDILEDDIIKKKERERSLGGVPRKDKERALG
jgi:hypothetical protein